ncbi:VWA domain-containing protein [Apibacter raozihei]|uniref:VWA domain-containing protein n=1 Tax=Apibacter raozihei TaxID=2500547 RepID=UPI000FE3FF1C|nr:VWA domain-containing protein [Apibacter raozihei]
MNWELEKTSYLYLLLLLPFLIWRVLYLYKWKKSAVNKFADSEMQKRIFGNINFSAFIRDNILVIISFFMIVLGLVNWLGGMEKKQVKREGIDMVFVIDVSNSMNAEDVIPSRMEKAKKIVSDLITKLGGDRVGIVIFAGQAYSVMPLSNDYGAAELYLSGVDTNLISAQGTNIADAVLEASNMLSNIANTSKAIILVSDGETHKGEVNKAVNTANKNDITIFSVGIGTPQGAPIPVQDGGGYTSYKKDEEGNVVLTRLVDTSLKNLAFETKGAYFYGGGPSEQITKEIFDEMSKLGKKEQSLSYTYDSKQYFQFFIGIALLLLIIISLTNYKRDFNV